MSSLKSGQVMEDTVEVGEGSNYDVVIVGAGMTIYSGLISPSDIDAEMGFGMG